MTKKERARDSYLRRKYGITLEKYRVMLESQDGKCDVCRKPQSNFTKSFAVDHNHRTGQVRGLLCSYCNHRLVGKYRIETVTKVFRYLVAHEVGLVALSLFDTAVLPNLPKESE